MKCIPKSVQTIFHCGVSRHPQVLFSYIQVWFLFFGFDIDIPAQPWPFQEGMDMYSRVKRTRRSTRSTFSMREPDSKDSQESQSGNIWNINAVAKRPVFSPAWWKSPANVMIIGKLLCHPDRLQISKFHWASLQLWSMNLGIRKVCWFSSLSSETFSWQLTLALVSSTGGYVLL